MVSVADEEGHLVLMGVDATYCVVDEVDTTTTTINDQFLHQAIEDVQTTVKQEPVGPDSEGEDWQHDSLMQMDDIKPTIQASQQSLPADPSTSSHPQSPPPILPENIKIEIEDGDTANAEMDTFTNAEMDRVTSSEMDSMTNAEMDTTTNAEMDNTTNAEKALSNSSILRAALQRQPISLREPENADSSQQQQSTASSDSQNVEIIDSATGKALVPPVLKHKPKQNSQSKSPSSGSEVSGEKSEGETGGGKMDGVAEAEKKEGEDKGKGESNKRKRSRDKPYQCGVCQRWFGCKSHVVEHMRTHTGEKPFECAVCHKRFSQKSNIHQHMNTHTQQRPFRCSDCGKDFMYRGSLYKHKRLHTGERPYTCGLCDRRFTHASQLFEHLRTHTNERPFKCGVCGRAFAHSGTMHRHQRGHFNGGRTKAPVVEAAEREKEGGAVSDINHNTPTYKSRMETPQAEAGTSVRVVDCSQPGSQPAGSDAKSSKKKITKIVIGKGLSLSPYLVSDVSGKGQKIMPAGKTPPGPQGSPGEGDVGREESNASPSAPPAQAATAVLGEKTSGNIGTSSIAPSGEKPEKESSPLAISAEERLSPTLVSAGTQSSPQKQPPVRTSAKNSAPKSTSRKRKSGKSPPSEKGGATTIPVSSAPMPFSQLFVVTSASATPGPSDIMSFSHSAGNAAGSASLPSQANPVPAGSSEAVSQLAVLSAVPLETGDKRSVVKMEVQDPRQNKTVTLLLTSAMAGLPGLPQASSPPPPKPLAPKPPPSSAKKSPAKRASPGPSQEVQKKKRTRLETPDLKVFSCDICSRSFCHRRSVKRHKLACHPEWDPYSEGKGGGEDGNRDKGVQVKMASGQQQKEGGHNHINTKLLKSLLTLTAQNKPTSSHPQSTVEENRPMGTMQGDTQPVEMQEENQPMARQRDTPPMEMEGDAQPMKSLDLGEASASLQAIAHLCGQGQTPDVNQNTLMALEKEGKDHWSCEGAERGLCKKSVEEKGKEAAKGNQNLSSGQGSTPTPSHSMPKIAFKASRLEPTNTTPLHHNQNRGQESDLPSGASMASILDKGDTDRSVSAESSSSQGKDSLSSLDNFDAVDSVVVKLEPVDDMELD